MDFALQYALKEIKKRPMEFLPILLTSIGVLILIFNLIIFFESQRVTDIAYYRLDFEIKLFEMTDKDMKLVEALPYVKSVKNVGKAGTLYIALNPPYNQTYQSIYDSFVRLIDDIDLWSYPYYAPRQAYYLNSVSGIYDRGFSGWFNSAYLDSLRFDPIFQPQTMTMFVMAAILMASVMVLVFNLKLKKNINEYAMLRAIGMTAFDIMKINMFQGIGIMLLSAIPTFGISAFAMKLVCDASHNIYPEIKDNTPLTYVVPMNQIITVVIVATIVSSIALLLVCRFYNRRSIVELINGTGVMRIKYVEKSSDKFEKAQDFTYYGKIYNKRTRKGYMGTNILYVMMLVFPLFFVYNIINMMNYTLADFGSTAPKMVYSLSPQTAQGLEEIAIPGSIVDEIRNLDGVAYINRYPRWMSADNFYVCEYDEEVMRGYRIYNYSYDKPPEVKSGNLEDLKINGTIAISEYFGYNLGDEVTLEYSKKVTVAVVLKDSGKLVQTWQFRNPDTEELYSEKYHLIFCGSETYNDWFEPEEIEYRYTNIWIYAEQGREEEVIDAVIEIAGIEDTFDTIYEQSQYNEGITGRNQYLSHKKRTAVNIFICVFIFAQIVFLFVSAAMIISSINNFNINKRRAEFAIIRALGEMRGNIIRAVNRLAVVNAVITAAIASFATFVVSLYLEMSYLSREASFESVMKVFWDFTVGLWLAYIFTFAFMIIVNFVSSLVAVRKTTGDSLVEDIREL